MVTFHSNTGRITVIHRVVVCSCISSFFLSFSSLPIFCSPLIWCYIISVKEFSRWPSDRWSSLSLSSVHDWCLSFLSICLSWNTLLQYERGSASFIFCHFIPTPRGFQISVCFSLTWHTFISGMAWVLCENKSVITELRRKHVEHVTTVDSAP